MERQGSAGFFGGPDYDSQIYIPITSLEKFFGGRNRNYTISVKSPSMENIEDFEYEIIGEMRKIRKQKPTEADNFAINSMETLLNAYNNVMGTVVLIGLVITGISLFSQAFFISSIFFT